MPDRVPVHTLPTLFIFSGLPASGKTTLARKLSAYTGAIFLRIDTLEQSLRDFCSLDVQGEGYQLAYRLAKDNLQLGCSVVADACNAIALTREAWRQVAQSTGAKSANIEVFCSDIVEHQTRVETRTTTVPHLKLPDWDAVINREYHPWQAQHHTIDTAHRSADDCFEELLRKLDLSETM
ncbi:MAG: AAA family ATPase [Spirulina sp. SIO3F2]|nr:AAA family ATPase [Spirulina sp. SIO3F2]